MADFELHEAMIDEDTGVAICFYRIPGTNQFRTIVYLDEDKDNGERS